MDYKRIQLELLNKIAETQGKPNFQTLDLSQPDYLSNLHFLIRKRYVTAKTKSNYKLKQSIVDTLPDQLIYFDQVYSMELTFEGEMRMSDLRADLAQETKQQQSDLANAVANKNVAETLKETSAIRRMTHLILVLTLTGVLVSIAGLLQCHRLVDGANLRTTPKKDTQQETPQTKLNKECTNFYVPHKDLNEQTANSSPSFLPKPLVLSPSANDTLEKTDHTLGCE